MIYDYQLTRNYKRSDFPDNFQDLTTKDKIDLFIDRIKYEMLVPADSLANGYKNPDGYLLKSMENADYAVLSIISNYFEGYGKYYDGYIGDYKAKYFFKYGFDLIAEELGWFGIPRLGEAQVEAIKEFFKKHTGNDLELEVQGLGDSPLANTFYKEVRCGLYHIGQVGKSIRLCNLPTAFIMMSIQEFGKVKSLHVNPRFLVKELLKHLTMYETKLLDSNNSKLIENFVKRFDYDNKGRF